MPKTGFDGTKITLQAVATSVTGTEEVELTSSSFTVGTTTVQDEFILELNDADLDKIKLATTLAVVDANDNTKVTTFVVCATTLHSDFNSRAVTEIAASGGKALDTLKVDETKPNLVSFEIDMDTPSSITLTFDEPVLASSTNPLKFTIQDAETATVTHPLTAGTKSTTNGREITITMAVDDLNAIKGKAMASEADDTHITFTEDAITDMTGNKVVAIANGAAEKCKDGGYTGDLSKPSIDSFEFDLNTGIITLRFSETASASSVDVEEFTIQSDASGTVKRVLTPTGTTKSTTDALAITITLNDADLNFIKADTGLASTEATTYLAWTEDAATDVSENKVTSSTGKKVAGGKFTPDTTDPELDDFSINMNTGTVTLTFSESVDSSSLVPGAITLQSAADGNAGSTKKKDLAGKKSSAVVTSTTISFVMLDTDLEYIKNEVGFAGQQSEVFLSATSALVKDKADTNQRAFDTIAIGQGKACRTDGFAADTTNPTVSSFTISIDDKQMVITASEPLLASSLDASEITLFDSTGTEQVALTSDSTATIVGNSVGKVVNVAIGDTDMNNIKANTAVAISTDSTILTLTTAFATDAAGVEITKLEVAGQNKPSSYGADNVNPTFDSCSLNMATGKLKMVFAESMTTAGTGAFDPTKIKIISSQTTTPTRAIQLTGGTLDTVATELNVIVLDLSDDDLDSIKEFTDVGTLKTNTFVEMTSATVKDTKALAVTAVAGTSAVQADPVDVDNVKPTLASFRLSMKHTKLYLTFSEIVDVSTFDQSTIVIQKAQSAGNDDIDLDSESTKSTADSKVIEITLSDAATNTLRLDTAFGTATTNTYLKVTSATVKDMALNTLEPPATPPKASEVEGDDSAPVSDCWS
jgi:hypothetical protein